MSESAAEQWMSDREAAIALGVSRSTVRRIWLDGHIFRREHGQKRYRRRDVERIAQEQSQIPLTT
jgi:predicted site-specific integrase-resolvase